MIGISATLTDDRVIAALGADARVRGISVANPYNDIMRRKEDLRALRRVLRSLLNEIKATHGEKAEIVVFSAVPVSAAVEIGRVWMPQSDLPVVVHDQNRATGGFAKALVVRQAPTPGTHLRLVS